MVDLVHIYWVSLIGYQFESCRPELVDSIGQVLVELHYCTLFPNFTLLANPFHLKGVLRLPTHYVVYMYT